VLECWVSDLGDPADQTEWRLWRNSRLIGRKVMLGY
jgi:hypothetical protein